MPKLVQIKGPGRVELVDLPTPEPGEHEFLVENFCAAQNPTDWQTVHEWHPPTSVSNMLGCDYAGVVISCHPSVTRFRPGDRVAGLVFGNLKDSTHGAFGEFVLGHEEKAVRVPVEMGFESAATLGVALMSVGQAFYVPGESLELVEPGERNDGNGKQNETILINGGSSAVGAMAVQFAKLSGANVIAIASVHNFSYVYGLGADKVYDRLDPELPRKIKQYTKGNLTKALDTIATSETLRMVEESLSSRGGHIHTLLRPPPSATLRRDIRVTWATGYSVWGEGYTMRSGPQPVSLLQKESSTRFFSVADKLLNRGKIKTHPVKIMEKGLENVEKGLQAQRRGELSAEKIVYRIADTPTIRAQIGWGARLWGLLAWR